MKHKLLKFDVESFIETVGDMGGVSGVLESFFTLLLDEMQDWVPEVNKITFNQLNRIFTDTVNKVKKLEM